MFFTIFAHELRRHLKSPLLPIATAFFFMMTFFFGRNTDPDTVVLMLRLTREWHNAPLIIGKIMAVWGGMGLLVTMIMSGKAVVRDIQTRSQDFFFTAPISKHAYLGGRLAGSLAASLLTYAGVVAGFCVSALVTDPQYFGPFSLSSFAIALGVIALPNVVITGSLFFALATDSRKMIMTYVVGIAFLLLSLSVSALLAQGDNLILRALADPFGYAALTVSSLDWTISEINSQGLPLTQYLILNRLLWLGFAVVGLIFMWRRFRMHTALERRQKERNETVEPSSGQTAALPRYDVSESTVLVKSRQLLHWVMRDLTALLKHPAFIILAGMGVANVLSNFLLNVDMTGNKVQPLTSWYLAHTQIAWGYMIPLVILFGGMLVWKERDANSHALYDVLPLPDGMAMASKLLVLVGMQFVYCVLVLAVGVLSQWLMYGYTQFEWPLYFETLFGIEWLSYFHMAVAVVLIQNLSSTKTLGFFISTIYFVADIAIFGILSKDWVFLRFGHVPPYLYSDINGFGHYGALIGWYTLLWAVGAVLMLTITTLLWRRDEETSFSIRWRRARRRFRGSYGRTAMISATVFAVIMGWVMFNRYGVNDYRSVMQMRAYRALYEQRYVQLAVKPQPMPTHIDLNVAFDPPQRRCHITGQYRLQNQTDLPVDTVMIHLSRHRVENICTLELSRPGREVVRDRQLGVRLVSLDTPLMPGDTVSLNFDLEFAAQGFTDNNPQNELAANGSSLVFSAYGWPDFFPYVGYNESLEMRRNHRRERFGLEAKPDCLSLEAADEVVYGMADARVTFNAVVSSTADQSVVSNGDLVESWDADGRCYRHFVSDVPMRPEFNFTSQRFAVHQSEADGVEIEVYYHPDHDYNVSSIAEGTAHALTYGNTHFSPYPYHVLRVQENNEYMTVGGARAMPSLIQWRESAGFLSRLDSSDINMVYFIAAHEMAHQWWGATLMPENLEGAVLATEMLAQYTATRCFEERFGKAMTLRLLARDRRDYLNGRQRDLDGEKPMIRSRFTYYMTYAKSNLIMYALTRYLGEEAINRALCRVLEQYQYRDQNLIRSTDLVEAFRAETPPHLEGLLDDFFLNITLWENEARGAEAVMLGDNRYQVTLNLAHHKFYADSAGTQTAVSGCDWLPVSVLDENEAVLFSQIMPVTAADTTLTLVVQGRPAWAGVDVDGLLVDRKQEDNRCKVSIKTAQP